MERKFLFSVALVIIAVGIGVTVYFRWRPGPGPGNGTPHDPPNMPVVFHSNCLSPEDRKVFYHLAEGSEVYPLAWLRATKRVGSDQLFLENMERFGMLPDPDSEEKLPVGLTAAQSRGLPTLGKMVGINCAACHVGQITYKGKALRIDGAPNMFDGNKFFTELVQSGQAILSSPTELIGFLSRLHEEAAKKERGSLVSRVIVHLKEGESELKTALLSYVANSVLYKDVRTWPKDWRSILVGAGGEEATRKKLLDGFTFPELPSLAKKAGAKGSPLQEKGADEQTSAVRETLEEIVLTNRLLKARLVFLENLAQIGKDKPNWGFGRVDAFGSVRALYFQPDYVPDGPVSYPHIFAFYRNPWFHYDGNTTSVLQRNLGQALGVGAIFEPTTYASTLRPIDSNRLEEIASKIGPPAWPADFFSPLDQDKIKKGEAHFQKHCVSCHKLIKPTEQAPDLLEDLKALGTDPQRATAVVADLPKTGNPFYTDLAAVLNKVTQKALDDSKVPPEKQKEFNHSRPVDWRTTRKYAARPLWGVWATAPYLHNGSVPTLYDLLLPAKDRPRTFPVGQREYDPVKVGYITTVDKPLFTFDTSKVGNGNGGHEYGTGLTDTERYELIEFLKTL
jgi:hypothetical protein